MRVGGHRRYDLAKLRPELFRAAEAAQRKPSATPAFRK
jgi:hypothetical protein